MNAHLIPASGDLKGRAVEEWRGKSNDDPVPPRVRRRVLLRFSRTCYWSGVAIRPGDAWDLDHIVALVNGGSHAEANLAPIRHGRAHQDKTQRDLDEAVLVRRMGDKHYGNRPQTAWSKRYHQTKEWLARKQQSEGE